MRTRFLAIAAVVGVMACDHEPVTDPFAPLALDLDLVPETATLTLGSLTGAGSVNMTAVAKSLGVLIPTPPGRVFTSSDTSVVIVERITGRVIATGVGTAQIQVRVNDIKGFATITVVPP
jgi:hypothetical protein